MLKKSAEYVVRAPWAFILFFVVVSVVFACYIPRAEMDPELKNMLPSDIPARVNIDRIEEIFGGTDMIMVVLSTDDVLGSGTLERLRKISRKMERSRHVDRVLSLFTLKDIRSEDSQMIVDPAVKRIPRTEEERQRLREALQKNDLVYGNVVSKDFRNAVVIGMLDTDADDDEMLGAVRKIIEDVPGPETATIAGLPYVRANVSQDMRGDFRKFVPIGLLIMLIFLFICFRQLIGVFLPFIVVVMAIIFTMGLIPVIGWKIHMITVILPVLLIAVANDYGIHIVARYQEENRPDSPLTSRELARKVVQNLFLPIVFTAVTTIAGLVCLLAHIIIPAKQIGILASLGIAYALLGSLLLIPAVLAVVPKPRPVLDFKGSSIKRSLLEKLLRANARFVIRRPKATLIGQLIVVFIISTGLAYLKVDTNPVNYYSSGSPVVKSADLVNRNFGGSTMLSVVAQGDIKSPDVLNQINDLEQQLASLPDVGETTSIAEIVRKMNRVMNEDDPEFDRIPETREAVAQYFLLYSMSGEPQDFDRLVDFPYKNAQLTARINILSSNRIAKVVRFVNSYLKEHPDSPFKIVGGFANLFADLIHRVVHGQVISLILSLFIIAVLVMILFRSVTAGLLSSIPLGLAMLMLFGLMGYLHIELNIATAMLSSIMIGVGVDYSIHYLWRYREERKSGKEPAEAIFSTLTTTGRGIIFNALSVAVGFVVLLASNFLPVRFFGFLVVISIGSCLVGAMVLLPAICLLFKPGFLEPDS